MTPALKTSARPRHPIVSITHPVAHDTQTPGQPFGSRAPPPGRAMPGQGETDMSSRAGELP